MPRIATPEIEREVAALAQSGEPVFATKTDLRDWLACVIRRRVLSGANQSRRRCSELAAAACAVRFECECPLSSTPGELDEVFQRLTAPQLEAILRMRKMPVPER